MSKLYLFCGLPGSGKTTLSRELGLVTRAQFIDLDDFKRTDVDPDLVRSQIDPPELRRQYYEKAVREAERRFSLGVESIVMEEVFHLSGLREEIEMFCEAHSISLLWIEVRCPYEVVKRRLSSNPRIGHILSTDEALVMYRLFEGAFEPFFPENPRHLVINNAVLDNLEETVTLIKQKMERR